MGLGHHLYHLGLSNSSDAIEQQVLVSLASGPRNRSLQALQHFRSDVAIDARWPSCPVRSDSNWGRSARTGSGSRGDFEATGEAKGEVGQRR